MGVWLGDPWIDWSDLQWAGQVPTDAEVRAADTEFRVRKLAVICSSRMFDARNWPEDIRASVADPTTLPVHTDGIADAITRRRRELLGR